MARGPKAIALHLSQDERAELERIVRRRSAGQSLVQRSRIVLACAEPGATNAGVARALGVSRPSVTTGAEPALRPIGWTGWGTRPAPELHARSETTRSSAGLRSRWRRNPRAPRPGQPAPWRSGRG